MKKHLLAAAGLVSLASAFSVYSSHPAHHLFLLFAAYCFARSSPACTIGF
jgi:uncharacterized membrane protein YbaN (DUF454 family)